MGLGITKVSKKIFDYTLKNCKKPIVLDADAINLINVEDVKLITGKCVLTPHIKEFE